MFFFKKRKKVQTQQQPSEPAPESLCVTTVLTSEQTSILDIANLQGIGSVSSSRMPSEFLRQTAMKQTEF